jgi:hypothetical protein
VKSHRILTGLSVLVLTIGGLRAGWVVWDHLHTLYITPETESSFIKHYTPQRVIERFQCRLPSSFANPSGGEAGQTYVAHTAGFEWFFAMRSDKWMPLMDSLSDDMSSQLLQHGAQILSRSGDPRSGFHFDYKLGKSIGTVAISPLEITRPSLIHRGAPLPEGIVDVTAHIELAEKWYPKEPGVIQVTVSNSVQ